MCSEHRFRNIALVADGNPLTLELIASMLEELGCETLTSRSGTEALGRLAKEKVDLLVADINMPGLSGIALAQHVRSFRPEIQVLLLSGREKTVVVFPCFGSRFPNLTCAGLWQRTTGLCDRKRG
jgi:two-component system, cell cycle response regulator CpdR